MDTVKHLQQFPRFPFDLSKYDLTGVKIDEDFDHVAYVNYHQDNSQIDFRKVLKTYRPNIEGNISFVIYHPVNYNRPFDIQQLTMRYLTKSSMCDLENGHMFLITIPFSMFPRFSRDYLNYGRQSMIYFIDINVNDVFTFPIYNTESFSSMINYQRNMNFLTQKMPNLVAANIKMLPYINNFTKVNESMRHALHFFGQLIASKPNNREVLFYNNRANHQGLYFYGDQRFNIYVRGVLGKNWLDENKYDCHLWDGSMHSLERWKYTNTKEQLKAIWDSRFLDMIDF